MVQGQDNPRPEYPRPDRQRSFINGVDWLNLNGPWQFRFDPQRLGVAENWFAPGGVDWREQIIVPFCWESLAAWGEGDSAGNENYYATRVFLNPLEVTKLNHRSAPRYEVGWYRRLVEIPADGAWKDRRVILTIGAADFFADCWCNGAHLGHHEGGYIPFEFDLTDQLEAVDGVRRALLVLRVEDPMENHEQPVGKQWHWYTPTSGIWQTIYVEPRPIAYIDRFQIVTDIGGATPEMEEDVEGASATFTLWCANVPDGKVAVEIAPPRGAAVIRGMIAIKDGWGQKTIGVRPRCLWDHTNPQLYGVRFALESEGGGDVVHGYFGLRKIGTAATEDPTAPAMLSLNNQPMYPRGALYQSFFPDGVYTAGDTQMLRDDITFAKRAGFDFLRVHIKIDDPLLLYYADTMGIMLMEDFPNFGEGGDTAKGRQYFEQMMRAAIARDYNHPSIIAWCLFNETWGFGGQVELVKMFSSPSLQDSEVVLAAVEVEEPAALKLNNQGSLQWVQSMWHLAKSLDPTRLVEDMSVVNWTHLDYYAHGETDVNSWHFYINDYDRAREHIEDVVDRTYSGSTFNYVPGYQQGAQPLINSEYGGVGALDGDRDVSWSFKFLTNELRRHSKLSAYIYTELHDVEWEYNGFLNYDRSPKQFGYDTTIVNQGDVLPVDAAPIRRYAPGEKVTLAVSSSHFARQPKKGVTLHWRLSGMDSFGRVHADLDRGWAPIAFRQYRVELARRIEFQMPSTPMLCTASVFAVGRDGTKFASNFVHYFVSAGALPEAEPIADGFVLRASPQNWAAAEWSQGQGSRSDAENSRSCFGLGHGFFEWHLPVPGDVLARAVRVRMLCEASSCRPGGLHPQTDWDGYATSFEIALNGIRVYEAVLPNHPHDARGALSYLRGDRGAYGYLARPTIDGELLQQVRSAGRGDYLQVRCLVPAHAIPAGGLTVYGHDTGRYPVDLTVVLEC